MGVFLGFDRNDLLVEVIQCSSGPFGSLAPSKVLPVHPHSLELAPSILIETRPEVFELLIDHAGYTRNGLQVASLDELGEAMRKKAIVGVEMQLVDAALSVRQLDLVAELVELPPTYRRRRIEGMEAVDRLRVEAELLHDHKTPVHVPEPLARLAGKIVGM